MKTRKTDGVIPFSLLMGEAIPTHHAARVAQFVNALRAHERHEWCAYREYGGKQHNASSTAWYLRKRYPDIDWQIQSYPSYPGSKRDTHWRVLAIMKKFNPYTKEKSMKNKSRSTEDIVENGLKPITVEVRRLCDAWLTAGREACLAADNSAGVEFIGTSPTMPSIRRKYADMARAIAAQSPEWGIMFEDASNQKCHTKKYYLRERFGKRIDGSPYLEFMVFKRSNGNWAVAARLPLENAL
jgi:hypothetical protein